MTRRVFAPPDNSDSGPGAYETALHELVSEISPSLLKDRKGYYITQLHDRYRELLSAAHIPNAEAFRTDRLKKSLIEHFCSAVQIIRQQGKSSLVCGSRITVGEMVAITVSLQEQLMQM